MSAVLNEHGIAFNTSDGKGTGVVPADINGDGLADIFSVERDHASTTLWQGDYPEDVVLLFGNENDGVPKKLLDASAKILSIPMYGINHSYPVAIAAGMMLIEWARRRDPRGGAA